MDTINQQKTEFLKDKIQTIIEYCSLDDNKSKIHPILSDISVDIYEQGYSALDLIEVICSQESSNISTRWTKEETSQYRMKFHSVKSEFRCEKLLILYMLNYIFVESSRENSRV